MLAKVRSRFYQQDVVPCGAQSRGNQAPRGARPDNDYCRRVSHTVRVRLGVQLQQAGVRRLLKGARTPARSIKVVRDGNRTGPNV
jgi:hypothetical protein